VGAIKTTVFIEFVNLFIYTIFVWLVVIRQKPTPAIAWTAEILYQAITLLFCLAYLLWGNWRSKKL
jgi:hypothetical protein